LPCLEGIKNKTTLTGGFFMPKILLFQKNGKRHFFRCCRCF